MNKRSMFAGIAGTVVAFSVATSSVFASGAMLGTYYKVKSTNPDFSNPTINQLVHGLVLNDLGPNGLPLANPNYTPSGDKIKDVSGTGEVQWWTERPGVVEYEKTRIDNLDFNWTNNFFADGQSANTPYFRTARWQGVFTVTQDNTPVSFRLSADDDAWLFINDSLFVDNGGVKAYGRFSTWSGNLNAGTYTMDLFFADRKRSQSALVFSTNVNVGIPQQPSPPIAPAVPEPGSILLAITGLGGISGLIKLRRNK